MASKIRFAVIWSPAAASNLADIIDYLETTWKEKVIRAYLARLDDLVDRIQSFPKIGRKSRVRRNVHLIVLEPHHQLVHQYIPGKNVIPILQLGDMRQDPYVPTGKLGSSIPTLITIVIND